MLTIRPEQLSPFVEARRLDFENRALRLLASEYPRFYEERGEKEVRRFLQRVVRRAKFFALVTELGVITFAQLSVTYGENFYQNEGWASHILSHDGIDAAVKVERLQEYVAREGEESS